MAGINGRNTYSNEPEKVAEFLTLVIRDGNP